jgi:nucleotide-binding universal stress UspA family protein
MYKTLLWATDGSPESDHSLETALALLEPHGRLVAFHCDQRFLGNGIGSASVVADELQRQRHINAQVESLRACGIDARLRIEATDGSPPAEIAAAAVEAEADVIVCATRALHGVRALVTGSVAARLLRTTTVPVVVVPAAAPTSSAPADGGRMSHDHA